MDLHISYTGRLKRNVKDNDMKHFSFILRRENKRQKTILFGKILIRVLGFERILKKVKLAGATFERSKIGLEKFEKSFVKLKIKIKYFIKIK